MEAGSVFETALTDGDMAHETFSTTVTKRSHQCVGDSTEHESLLTKKQAVEALDTDLITEASDNNNSTLESASLYQTASSQFTDSSSIYETAIGGRGDVPTVSGGNSSTESTGCKETPREENSFALSTSQTITRIRKLKIIFGKSRGSGNTSLSTDHNATKENGNGMSYGGLKKDPWAVTSGAGRLNESKWVDSSEDLEAVARVGIMGSGTIPLCHSEENLELKICKKLLLNGYTSSVKKLLSTGLLEGVHVKYIYKLHKKELPGIIKGCGYLCGCPSCNFAHEVNAFVFEKHSGHSTKHPNNHVFLDNGKTVYGVAQELRISPLNSIDKVIKTVLGGVINEQHYQAWLESFQAMSFEHKESKGGVGTVQVPLLQCHYEDNSIECFSKRASEDSLEPSPRTRIPTLHIKLKNPMMQKKSTDLSLVARSPSADILHEPRVVASNLIIRQKCSTPAGAKKKDNDLHRLIFMPNGLPDGTPLAYYAKGQRFLDGYKQGNGIFCSCCSSQVSPSQFEAHAGWATRRQPYRHIYTSNGLSLHDISISLSNGQSLDTGDSDDSCTVCGDDGELLLCDRCPRAFHTACLELQYIPEGDWYCPYCKDNFGTGIRTSAVETSLSARRPIFIRLKRVVKAPTTVVGGCVVCRCHDFSVSKFDERTVLLCDQCEKEYHVGCLKDKGLCDLKELPRGEWFCCADCCRIHTSLQNLISKGSETIPASLSSLIEKKLEDKGLTNEAGGDVHWQLLSGKNGHSGNKLLLSKAAAIFRDCFDPIVVFGRDLIPAMVYGRNIAGQEFGGTYCVVLTVNSVVVSAGILRIFGQEVAELPLVATNKESQGKGYFQVLFSCIERLLCHLNVENLVLPAAEEAESIWTNKFGFSRMTEERLQKYRRDVQIMMFQGTSMLEKAVTRFCD